MKIKERYCQVLLKLCATVLIGLLFVPVSARAQEKVEWMEAVAPPFFIHEGPLAGQGYEDVVTEIITDALPEYDHQKVIANISRHYQDFKNGRRACNVGFFKTPEREQFLYYSIPSFFTLPAVMIINKSRFAEFGHSKTVSLEEVLNKEFVVGRATNRSYGKDIDHVLDRSGNDRNIYAFEGNELSLQLFQMLKHKRIDALISLPEEAVFQAERLGFRDQIMTLTIAENQDGYDGWLSYVACSKNDWGKQFITKINRILLRERPTKRYRQAYERWLDESSIEGYRKLYNEIFLKSVE